MPKDVKVDTVCGRFDLVRYHKLRRAYEDAIEEKKEKFEFQKGEYMTILAGQLLEFLQPYFKKNKK